MKKAERAGTLRAQKCPRQQSRKISDLVRELAKVSQVRKSLRTLSAFFRFVRSVSPARRIFAERAARNLQTVFRLFSCQTSKKRKRAATFQSLSRTFASPLLKQFLGFRNPLIFMFRERKHAAPAFLNLRLRTVRAAECRIIFRIIKIYT